MLLSLRTSFVYTNLAMTNMKRASLIISIVAIVISVPAFVLSLVGIRSELFPPTLPIIIDVTEVIPSSLPHPPACRRGEETPLSAVLLDITVINSLDKVVFIKDAQLQVYLTSEKQAVEAIQETGSRPQLTDFFCTQIEPPMLEQRRLVTVSIMRSIQPDEVDRFGVYIIPEQGSEREPGIWRAEAVSTVRLCDTKNRTIAEGTVAFKLLWVENVE